MSNSALRTHPIFVISGIAVTIFALVGTAAILGWLPKAHTEEGTPGQAKVVSEMPAEPSKMVAEKPAEKPKARTNTQANTKVASAESARRATTPATATAPAPVVCNNCGVIRAVNVIEKAGEGSGLGAVAGGVVGGLLGNQIGKGKGNTVATVAGVAGGAYAGHQVEKNVKKTQSYRITVRMNDGTDQIINQTTDPGLAIGEKVKIENGNIIRL